MSNSVVKRIYHSKSVKHLGIKIDENLSWKQHIHDIAIKLKRANALLLTIRNLLTLFWVEGKKALTSFSAVTFTNVRISPKNKILGPYLVPVPNY